MTTPTFDDVDDYLYQLYQANYKAKIEQRTINNKAYQIDCYKFLLLTAKLNFNLNLVKFDVNDLIAIKDIKVDQVITFYPVDILDYTPDADREKEDHTSVIFLGQQFEQTYNMTNFYNNKDIPFIIDKNFAVIGDSNFKSDTNYLGHLIKDGAKTDLTAKANEIYLVVSKLKANCQFRLTKANLHIAIIATKDIKAGDKLFIHHGLDYWKLVNVKK